MTSSGNIQLKNAELYYETFGSGEPLLLLHGNGQSISAFDYQITELAKHFMLIAVNTRGHGKSTDDINAPLTYDLFADDMRALLDALQIPKVNILGWSDGGNTGLIMAVKYPQYVSKLAVMGSNIFPGPEALSNLFLNQMQAGLTRLKTKTDPASKMQIRLLTLMQNEPHLTFDELHTIKAPVLVMAGEDDIILDSHTRAIAAAIPNSTLLIFEGGSHCAPIEIPERFNAEVIRFFK